jgi:hypothetical protein
MRCGTRGLAWGLHIIFPNGIVFFFLFFLPEKNALNLSEKSIKQKKLMQIMAGRRCAVQSDHKMWSDGNFIFLTKACGADRTSLTTTCGQIEQNLLPKPQRVGQWESVCTTMCVQTGTSVQTTTCGAVGSSLGHSVWSDRELISTPQYVWRCELFWTTMCVPDGKSVWTTTSG